jgi:hypothetical protein
MKAVYLVILFMVLFSSAESQSHLRSKKHKIKPYPLVSLIKTSDSTVDINEKMVLENKNLPLFIKELDTSPVKVSYSSFGIPIFIKSFLTSLVEDNFTIADPGKPWNCCCNQNDSIPNRSLLCMGLGKHLFFLNYFTGGFGEIEHLTLIRFNSNTITDFWTGLLSGKPKTKKEIVKYLIDNKNKHWGLNTNMIQQQ